MNYFERLIRRALLEAPAHAGDAVRDPFENEAPLVLDVPVQKPALPPSAQLRPVTIEQDPVETNATHTETQIEHHRQAAEIPVPPAMHADPAHEIVAPRVFEAGKREAVAPLARADAFMHSLGVDVARVAVPPPETPAAQLAIVPVPEVLPTSMPSPPARAQFEAEKVPPRPRPASIVPPAAPRPQPQLRESPTERAREARAADKETRTPRAAPGANPRREIAREIVREKIHVVKVLQAERGASATAGAAPPTFGAAQL